MCVVSHMGVPCSKCGAPGLWKQQEQTRQRAVKRLLAVAEYVESLPDDCPVKNNLRAVLDGKEGTE